MQLKVPPPAVFLAAVLIMYAGVWLVPALTLAFPGQASIAAILALAGCLLGGLAVGAFWKDKTTIDPRAPESATSLVTSGVFRLSRNPMYLGLLSLLLALGVYWGTLSALVVVPVFVWYLTEFQIKPEEDRLKKVFGPSYSEYLEQVRRWI